MFIDGGTCRFTPNCMIHTGERRVPVDVRRGARSGYVTILTMDDVRAIRQMYDTGVKRSEITARFGISYSTMQDVGRRRTWKWLT